MNQPHPLRRRSRPARAGALALAATIASCAGRIPVLVPPPGGIESVEGFGSAAFRGTEAVVKGRFAFLFRRPGLGRVEALDPVGRTAFIIYFQEDRAYFVLPGKKAYAEDPPEAMMDRLLGVSLVPDEMIRLLSGRWGEDGPASGGRVERDAQGRIASGERGDFAFEVLSFFPGAGVPRELALSGSGTSGRLKILSLGFNPPLRPGAFDTAFERAYARKSWDEMMELIEK